MHSFPRLLLLALVAALLLPAAGASAKPRVGLADQSPQMFSDPLFEPLEIKRVRYLVPWDWQRLEFQRAEVDAYMIAARARGIDVLVHFNSSRGCWNGTRYSRKKHCRAPSARKYRRSFKAFRKQYPWVRTYGAWNEINHKSQPTYRSPKRAARYYNVLRKSCRRCRIVAADLLDSSNLIRYTRKFKRHAKGRPRIWGLHNYSDVNRKRSKITRRFLRRVRGQVWLTETGGIVKFGRNFPYSERRAANRLKYMFRLANRFSRKRRGLRSRITRLYPYEWIVEEGDVRFDAALLGPDGQPRRGYRVFKAKARRFPK